MTRIASLLTLASSCVLAVSCGNAPASGDGAPSVSRDTAARAQTEPGGSMDWASLLAPAGMHAHNDYDHARPLHDALGAGADSIEADVFLVDGRVLVAHDREDCDPDRSFRALYAEPLAELFNAENDGGDPAPRHLFLLIDFKMGDAALLDALLDDLRPLTPVLTSARNGEIEWRRLTVILSGSSPRARLASMAERPVFIDGRIPDLGTDPAPSLVPLISANWIRTIGLGLPPEGSESRAKLGSIVDRAHEQGRLVRFWAAPDSPEGWSYQQRAGIDLINTDTPGRFADFARSLTDRDGD